MNRRNIRKRRADESEEKEPALELPPLERRARVSGITAETLMRGARGRGGQRVCPPPHRLTCLPLQATPAASKRRSSP